MTGTPQRGSRLAIPTAGRISWDPGHRVISMRQTPESAFEQIADADEVGAILEVVAAGGRRRVGAEDAATGAGAGWIMAAFLQGGPGRFNDDTFGAFYAAGNEATAIAETRFHYGRFLSASGEGHCLLGARMLHARIRAEPVDLRGRRAERPDLYDPDPAQYARPQRWAMGVVQGGGDGVVYDSVGHEGGTCVCVYRPRLVSACREADRLAYEWDGARFTAVYTVERREPA